MCTKTRGNAYTMPVNTELSLAHSLCFVRPKARTSHGGHGMIKGVVTGQPGAAGNYTVGMVAKFFDGKKVKNEATFNVTDYEVEGGQFAALQFVRDVQVGAHYERPPHTGRACVCGVEG